MQMTSTLFKMGKMNIKNTVSLPHRLNIAVSRLTALSMPQNTQLHPLAHIFLSAIVSHWVNEEIQWVTAMMLSQNPNSFALIEDRILYLVLSMKLFVWIMWSKHPGKAKLGTLGLEMLYASHPLTLVADLGSSQTGVALRGCCPQSTEDPRWQYWDVSVLAPGPEPAAWTGSAVPDNFI